jgi:NifU-like protein involved in Fe-S cluster formation
VDRANVGKTEARAESNTAHGVQLCIGESLDVALKINDAAAKMNRDARLDGVPVLDINSKRARCAVSLKVIL